MNTNFYNTRIAEPTEEEMSEAYNQWKRIRLAKYIVSSVLGITGFAILISQLGPLAVSYMQGYVLESQVSNIVDPAPSQVLTPRDTDLPYYDPGASYFQNLVSHIGSATVAGMDSEQSYPSAQPPITVNTEYKTPMFIRISSIGITDITISSNVDSLNEKVYNQALKKGLAHFQGTPLPGDGGNSFIYGHSAVDSFFTRHPNDPETIFSRLENIEIGDTVDIAKDGNTLTYVVQKKKITEPDDFDVILGDSNKETVTLMTCWPLGIGSKRLIVIAERIDG